MTNDPTFLLHRAFADQAVRSAGLPALQEGDRMVTFGELAARASRVRRLLVEKGIEPGDRVALHANRTIEGVAGMLGILQAGAAVVPVSPSDPPDRMAELFHAAGLGSVVDTPDAPLLARWAGPRVRSEEGEGFAEADPGPDEALPLMPEAESPPPSSGAGSSTVPSSPSAFILRSSGSTAAPKLIERSHASFLHRLRWTWERHPFTPGERGCQKAHVATTHAIYELFEPLLQGAPVVLLPDAEVRQLTRFWKVVRSRGVTRLLLVPSALRASLDLPGFAPPALRVMVLMGEHLDPGLAHRAIQAFPPDTALYSIYGSTEASSTLVCNLRSDVRSGTDVPLGVPVDPGIRVEVLDGSGRRVPEGATGRLHLGGTALFRGYLGDPERTAAALVDRGPGLGFLFDTRDDVRLEPGGRIVFLRRTDDTVKVRGFRVDLREVERCLLGHPGVTQAVVVARGEAAASSRLDAWVAPAGVDLSAVFETLRRHLPEFAVPASITPVSTFPLTPSGKVDRRRLASEDPPKPIPPGGADDHGDDDHGDPLVRAVTRAWVEVLGNRAFGPDQSFFEVGGTSLTTVRLVGALRRAVPEDAKWLEEEDVYRFPTIRAQVEALRDGVPGVRGTQGAAGAGEAGRSPLLVTLRTAREPSLAPLFLLASAGGTVGVYDRLVRELRTPREILGIRDPYLWRGRDPRISTAAWAGLYVEAIRSHQPRGPYHLGAYSSGGAFGIEVARQLRAAGEEVGLLALVDPLGLDRPEERTFGFHASRATWGHPLRRGAVRLWGRLRTPLVRRRGSRISRAVPTPGSVNQPNDAPATAEEVAALEHGALHSPANVLAFSALLELDTGHPVGLDPADLDEAGPRPFERLLDRVARVAPELDRSALQRIATQYPLQVRAQQQYRLQPLDAPTLLLEPDTPYRGLVHLVLRPWIESLQFRVLPLGSPTERVAHLAGRFGAWAPHVRCMRDDVFVRGLARALEARLDTPVIAAEAPVPQPA